MDRGSKIVSTVRDEKESQKRERERDSRNKIREEKNAEKRESGRKEIKARKGRQVLKTMFFNVFVAPEVRRVAEAPSAEPSGRRRDVKLRAAVARSTFRSLNAKK